MKTTVKDVGGGAMMEALDGVATEAGAQIVGSLAGGAVGNQIRETPPPPEEER